MNARAVYLETFGCQMNELDSELVAGALRRLGYSFTPDPLDAGVVLYNTCSVREQAEQKVWSRLGELAIRKQAEPSLVVGVLGCLAERDGTALIRRMPVVDILCGPGELDKLPALLDNAVRTRRSLIADDAPHAPASGISAGAVALQGNASRRSATLAAAEDSLELLDLSRAISPVDAGDAIPGSTGGSPRRSAYVRITRGCNKFCTYCVVPFTRGAEIHRPPEHIVDECRRLADAGVVEVTLLGQTVNHYRFEHGAAVTLHGHVQPQKGRSYAGGHSRDPFAGERVTTFADLLALIHERVPAIRRLRFVTSYPRDFGDDVLGVMRDHPRICRYLHVPAQSGSDRILKLMNRGYSCGEYLGFLDRARSFLDQPELGRPLMLSGDIIVGFPSETDQDHEATTALLRRARYKNGFIFKYSPRPGTLAFDKLADDVPDPVKRRRNNELLAIQTQISDEIGREQVGRTFEVFVQGLSSRQERKSLSQGERRKQRAVIGAARGVSLTIAGRTPIDDDDGCAGDHPDPSDHHQDACSPEGSRVFGTSASDGSHESPLGGGSVVQYSGRTEGDCIAFFHAPANRARELIGRIVPVQVESADRLSLHGRLTTPVDS
jgi:tRNA-2-methylthio-N6-dimethylallyladenosine synthase